MTDGTAQDTAPASSCRTRFAGLLAPGLPAGPLDGLAQALRLPAAAEPAGSAPLVALLSGRATVAGPAPDALWLPPVTAWIEPPAGMAASEPVLQSTARLAGMLTEAAGNDLYLNLTTATAHDLQLGGRLLAALSARHPLIGDRRDDMELALHEAVSNALVHGNLGVDGMKELSAQELARFSRDLGDRLADPALAARRIVIAIRIDPAEDGGPLATVEITDEGAGFTPGPRTNAGASGRGLDLIAHIAEGLEIEDGGRRIRMRFRL
ncbi:hypothetical protein TSH100_22260 [Azospirillum sp. TSH100]|uniref:ATP-binding protein n=1 Tax=Azospirillum sp. TSH100 TaxID=652764 RepID=UPI000D607BA5|nr:ATP-binding protein [Azospirillum sp. TSH100]PWC82714.1 hypothetical protein TSH100_22260 [Azospirillum sp. TSH100]QCG86561.1 ATP-binding protein [Azospirillum sp. TSH100]